ncbi:hypothetical protein [Variovorax sp. PBL-H6]|uniref:hypothetical protein n=1 Tax=Variovorax sp. PBL-H6 TaxID=434009 RepID=UPI0013A596EE|nr:hypothetical protein [Variovorax sp. PBL-H6]
MEANSKPIPDLHDAELYAVRHDTSSGTVECVVRKVDGHDPTLTLTGIERFRCSDFGLQNVVLELIVIDTTRRPTQHELRGHLQWISATFDGESLLSAQETEAAVQNMLDGRYVLVSLIPSWGAQIRALAQSIDWE